MPTARASAPFATAVTPGEHLLTLVDVRELEQPNLYREKPEDPETRIRWVWTFRSDTLDEDGKPMEYVHWTGPTYGDDRAALTELADWLMPDATFDEKAGLVTEKMIGNRYRAKIKQRKNKKDKLVPDVSFMEPDKAKPRDEAVAAQAKAGQTASTGTFDPDEIPF